MSLGVCSINWANVGPTEYWCLETTSNHKLAFASFAITFGTFLLCAICYFAIMRKLKRTGKELIQSTEHAIKHAAIERNVLRRITGYILIFFVKWLPAYVCITGFIGGGHPLSWTFIVVIISINLGGPGYAIQYVICEGFSDDAPGSCEQSIMRLSHDNRSPNPSFIQSGISNTGRGSFQPSIHKSNSSSVINVLVVPPLQFN
ncbi:6847_t:CDS:2 [Paraglomus occultum]|uniref:6847_t:CDS:1 n=1 Tax=Paraglomus occultum TaxID=144539 RepID=A0A9N9AKG8_9GLOM|nr:6847_t:CDS:2 [Paraglomus occultum]